MLKISNQRKYIQYVRLFCIQDLLLTVAVCVVLTKKKRSCVSYRRA